METHRMGENLKWRMVYQRLMLRLACCTKNCYALLAHCSIPVLTNKSEQASPKQFFVICQCLRSFAVRTVSSA